MVDFVLRRFGGGGDRGYWFGSDVEHFPEFFVVVIYLTDLAIWFIFFCRISGDFDSLLYVWDYVWIMVAFLPLPPLFFPWAFLALSSHGFLLF